MNNKENHKVYYRVDMHPLEPYTFGTDQVSRFQGARETGKESYIMASGNIPEQTTILGALRYALLEQEGILKSDFNYNAREKEQMKALIGERSFSFGSKSRQSFGVIQEISPLFLTEGSGSSKRKIYVKNPFHNKKNDGYQPMDMTDRAGNGKLETSFGEIHLPKVFEGDGEIAPEYDSKEGYGRGYICLSDKKAAPEDLFQKCLQAGNRTVPEGNDDSEGFFKRETVILKKGFAFSVYVTVNKDKAFPEETIAFMGGKRSAFCFRFVKMEKKDCDLRKQVEEAFAATPGVWYYALSDLYLESPPEYTDFSIVEEKSIRNLETDLNQKGYVEKRRRSQHQFHLIKSGSVFYGSVDGLEIKNENMEGIGYNQVVRLGGR